MSNKDACWLGKAIDYLESHSKIGEAKVRVLKYLIAKKTASGKIQETVREIAKCANASPKTVADTLTELQEAGLLQTDNKVSRGKDPLIYRFVY